MGKENKIPFKVIYPYSTSPHIEPKTEWMTIEEAKELLNGSSEVVVLAEEGDSYIAYK